jgi:small subunit ribosomal protein S10
MATAAKKTSAKVASPKKEAPTNKIRIAVKAFEHRILDEATKKIVATAKDSGATVHGPIPLPTKIEKITLNRSTFIDKNSREQFEIRRHKRLIEITNSTPKTLELLQGIQLPSGVVADVKVF